MSTISDPSFIDDGGSFPRRVPPASSPTDTAHWAVQNDMHAASSYTGSFVDDGADLLPASPTAPGFGKLDARYYKQRKRSTTKGVWNDDVQRAVSGDIQRSLAKIQGLGGVRVKRRGENSEKGFKMLIPRKWGTFVIKGKDGRVVVVGEDGEYDSEDVRGEGEMRWVEAEKPVEGGNEEKERRGRRRRRHGKEPEPQRAKSLSTIAESEYEEQGGVGKEEDVVSQTAFFATGAKSGWPSPSVSLRSADTGQTVKQRDDNRKTSDKPKSRVPSLPQKWSAPAAILIQDSRTSRRDSRRKGSPTCESNSSRSTQRNGKPDAHLSKDHAGSVKTYSTYRPPAVEDALETSSESVKKRWTRKRGSGSRDGNLKDLGAVEMDTNKWVLRVREESDRSHHERATSSGVSIWKEDTGGLWIGEDNTNEDSWDGFERVKAISEIGVADGDSGHESTFGRGSWNCDKARVDDEGWAESKKDDVAWEASGGGIKDSSSHSSSRSRASRYGKGHGEDDQTNLNDNWGGTSVRVALRRTSVGGWN
ncbi:hypothetical protein ACN47E_008243 [Coniothyrium glycines]